MRCVALAAVLCLSVLQFQSSYSAAPVGQAADPAPASSPAAPPPSDAAAKHAKLTACLKQAKSKKLLGADKTNFLKSCMASP
jgi:hypothetical protein